LLLVAVLVLAAAFIVLALVINSAIFTENLATREDVAGSEEALEYRADVTASISKSVITGNEDTTLSNTSALEDNVEGEIATLRTRGGVSQAIRGGVVEVIYAGNIPGQRIAQDNATRNLTNRNETADWTVAEDITDVRNVQFTFTEVDTLSIGSILPIPINNPFRLELDGNSGNTWTVAIASNTFAGIIDTDEIVVRVTRPDGTQAECVREEPTSNESLSVDVTGGSINGEPCHALNRLANGGEMWLGTSVGAPFDIGFENADNVNGTYSMVVDDGAAVDTSSVHSGYDPDEPHVRDALYAVELSYVYQNHAVVYEDTIRVAPGEVPP
jgi:hypothetical protein